MGRKISSLRSPSNRSKLSVILKRFAQVRVLVVGDLMLDRYIWGKVERISPEAPVPVVRVTHESLHAGGAGNVVANIRALGGSVVACGTVGKDQAGQRLRHELTTIGAGTQGVIASANTITTSKTRIIAHSQQVVRLDREENDTLGARIRTQLRRFVQQHITDFQVVVISDYGKGVVDAEFLTLLSALRSQHRFVYLIDPKRRNFSHYRDATLVKPNREEAGIAAGIEIRNQDDLNEAGTRLLQLWRTEAVLVSRSEEGMSLFKSQTKPQHFPTTTREVYDVTGAGDTVLATCALALGAGATLEEATILANHAAGVVVGKVGTATVSPEELLAALREE
jgi:rfaE bifunctional protein kinase chain/domain